MSWIRRTIAAVGVFAVFGAALVSVAAPASAATSCVQIYRIAYNSPGSPDRGSNTSLNGEWVQLHNRCRIASTLTNVRLRDAVGHTYTFSKYTLGPGKYVKIHTGRGTNSAINRYWGLKVYVWNNGVDRAYLYNHLGRLIDKCYYNNARASSLFC